MINRRSARFVSNDYNYTSSVTKMLKTLQWPSLATRWENQRLVVLMYKIVHGLRTVERDQTTQTSSRPSVHRHQSTRILLSSYYTSLELSVDAPQSTATPWTRSRLTSTNNSARYSLHRRDIPAWEFADYLSRSRSRSRLFVKGKCSVYYTACTTWNHVLALFMTQVQIAGDDQYFPSRVDYCESQSSLPEYFISSI